MRAHVQPLSAYVCARASVVRRQSSVLLLRVVFACGEQRSAVRIVRSRRALIKPEPGESSKEDVSQGNLSPGRALFPPARCHCTATAIRIPALHVTDHAEHPCAGAV